MPRAHALQREATAMRNPRTAMESSPRSPQLEQVRAQQRRPNSAKKKKKNTVFQHITRFSLLHCLNSASRDIFVTEILVDVSLLYGHSTPITRKGWF